MRSSFVIQLAALLLIVCLAAALGLALSTQRAKAAPPSLIWGTVLASRMHVSLQFVDDKAVTDSPWYAGTVEGYDGSLVVFVNDGYTDKIFVPLTSIRQIQITPFPAGAK